MKSLFTSLILAAGLSISTYAQNWSSAVNSGGANMQTSTGVVEQMDGSRIVVGTYKGNSLFGTYSLPWVTFSSDPINSNLNSFIVKYRPNNTIEWATRICSAYGAQISSASTDNSGNTYVCGMYSDICNLYDSAHASSPAGTLYNGVGAAGAARGFIAKYSKTGVLKWFRNGIGAYATDPECLADIKINENGTTLVTTGRIVRTSPIIVGGGSVSTGSYVLWLNPTTGSSIRAVNFTNDNLTSNPYSTGLCIDNSNNVIVSGKLTGGSYTVKGISNTFPVTSNNSGTATIYAKYNTSGNVSWAKVTNATLNNTMSTPSSIIVDDANNIYIGGWVKAHTTTNYYLLFPKASGYDSVQVVTTSPNHVYLVKLNSSGQSLWKCFGRRSAAGTEVVSLAKGPCNIIYAAINTAGINPSFTDVALTAQAISSPEQANTMIFKLNTNGIFQSSTPWAIYNMNSSSRSFIDTYTNGKVHCAGSIDISTTLTGVSGTFNPNGRDVFLASFTDNSSAPILSLNPTSKYCPYQNIPLNASSSSGTAPFTYTWEIWNSSTSTYVNLGTNSTGLFTLTPPVYNPYIYTLWSYQVIVVRVSVTNCSGITSSETRIIVINGNISYSQVNEVEVCYSPSVPAPDAVFSVNALNVGSYTWIYSPDGINWDYCYNYFPPIFLNNQSATMTVSNPTPALNGYLFACMMTGCNSVASEPALLTVLPCALVAPGGGGSTRDKQAMTLGNQINPVDLKMYPNPATNQVKFEISSTEYDLSDEWLVVVYDMTGRKIHQQQMRDGHCTIQTSKFTNGNYLCVIKHKGETISNEKLIVAH